MRGLTMMTIAFVLLPLAAFAAGEVNQRMVNAVKSGKAVTAKASWWGFDPEDSTAALQAAIDSGAKKVVVDNLGKPWIVRPITLASDQEIVFEPGVEVLAKKGEFKGKGDCLFSSAGGKNITLTGRGATLRMRRADYAGPGYDKAEWRTVLSLRGCSNVKVLGLTLAESGGDGIYLGTATKGVTNSNVTIKDVVCDGNYRQGISVITAENLLIENTVMRNTGGTAPQSGIDFEPNDPTERLANIVLRNCKTEHNRGFGYQFHLTLLDASSAPVSVRIEKCVSVGDSAGSASVCTANAPKQAVTGKIEFVNCSFKDSPTAGAMVIDVPSTGCKVCFADCSLLPAEKTAVAPIFIQSNAHATEPVGGVEFANCTVWDWPNRNPLVYVNHGKVPMRGVSGTLILESNGTQRTIELTPKLLDEWTTARGQ